MSQVFGLAALGGMLRRASGVGGVFNWADIAASGAVPMLGDRAMVAGTSHGHGGAGLGPTYTGGIWDLLIAASGKYQYISNVAVGGSNLDALVSSLVLNLPIVKPSIVFMDGPTNDLGTGPLLDNASMTAICNKIERAILLCYQAGAQPVFRFTPPRNGFSAAILPLLPLVMEICRYYKVPFFDSFSPLVDPVTGNYLTGYNVDSTHLNNAGRAYLQTLEQAAFNDLKTALPKSYMYPMRDITGGNWWNILRNGNFQYQTTPGVPNFWTINTTAGSTYTVTGLAVAPATGNVFAYSKAAAGQQVVIAGQAPSGSPAGSYLQVNARVKVAGLTPATATGFSFILDPGNGDTTAKFTNVPVNMDGIMSIEALFANASTPAWQFYGYDISTIELRNVTMWDRGIARSIHTPGLVRL